MKTISLTNSDRVVTVDDEFYLFLSRFTWCLSPDGRYAVANVAGTFMAMHQLILNSKSESDHIDHDGLHNQLINLHVATISQNMANRKKFSGKYSSKYKGIHFNKRDGVWRARIMCNGVVYNGSAITQSGAARWYDKKALELFGEFASLNFPKVTSIDIKKEA